MSDSRTKTPSPEDTLNDSSIPLTLNDSLTHVKLDPHKINPRMRNGKLTHGKTKASLKSVSDLKVTDYYSDPEIHLK